MYSPQTLIELIKKNSGDANDLRLRLRTEIRRHVSRIDLRFHGSSKVAVIRFANGAWKAIPIIKDDAINFDPAQMRAMGLGVDGNKKAPDARAGAFPLKGARRTFPSILATAADVDGMKQRR